MGYLDTTRRHTAHQRHRCSWCSEHIQSGSEYVRRFHTFDGPRAEKMHPECWEALKRESDRNPHMDTLLSDPRDRGKTFGETYYSEA